MQRKTFNLPGKRLVFLHHFLVFHGDADDLADPLALHGLLLHLTEVVVVRDHVRDDRLLVGVVDGDVWRANN